MQTLLERLQALNKPKKQPPMMMMYADLLREHRSSFIIRRCYKDGRMFVNHNGRRKQYRPSRLFLHELRKYTERREITTLKGLNGIECVVSWNAPMRPSYWFRTL